MTATPARISARSTLGLPIVALLCSLTGCTSLQLPPLPFAALPKSDVVSSTGAPQAPDSEAAKVYYSVRQARAQNSVVLQVEGDTNPARVMPLPPEGTSVFVSTILEQTGVQRKLGAIEVTVFRHSTDAIGGIPLAVKMSPDGSTVRPESDYALQPGDRVRVQEAPTLLSKGIVALVLGR